ncbi:MAG TPA: T9SS type A sorting domain-containing protein [Bacteroidia bacterium]
MTVSTNYSVTTNYVYVDYSIAHPGTYGYNRYSSLMADGYGTLNLPSGITYTNCLRLREIIVDSGSTIVSIDTTLIWLAPGILYPVLGVDVNTPWKNAYFISARGSAAGVKQLTSISNQVTIYPNPTSNQFSIEANTTDKLTLDLYDVNGRLVFSTTLRQAQGVKSNIDVSGLNEGVYTISIISNEGVVNKKVVILR